MLTRSYNEVEITCCVAKVFMISREYQSGTNGIEHFIKDDNASVQ